LGAVTRPLNFTVRRRGDNVATLIWALLFVVPYAVLTTAGVLLWRRSRSIATFMVALGFAAALLGQVAGMFISLEFSAAIAAQHAHQNGAPFELHYHVFPWLTHHVGLFGIWTAAVGLVWHASRKRPRLLTIVGGAVRVGRLQSGASGRPLNFTVR
jgi:hypothetical protein